MSLQAKAKFFCQNCNSEVAANAKFCPKCGKFFAAVRCPKCGHTGTVKDFNGNVIGTVNEIVTTSNITDRYAIVKPTVDFSKIDTVLIIKK